jgi:hypothetical protein
MDETPIFLTGFARSGTTWVNRLMRDYFDAGFVNEGQFILTFGSRITRYGDLHTTRCRARFLKDLAKDDFFSILARNYKVYIDWAGVLEKTQGFPEIVKSILLQIARQTGKRRIGSKYPVFGRHLSLLNALFPDCRVIHVVRDGRDCALSHKRVVWGHQNTYSAAVHWRRYIEIARRHSRNLSDRYLEIRYEDLLMESEKTMRVLENFITGTYKHGIAERFVNDNALLKTDKIGRWREDMPVGSQALFEYVAGDMLEACGYPLTRLAQKPSFAAKAGYVLHDRLTREGWNIARKVFPYISERK